MPRCLDPNSKFPLVLESDQDKDPAPTFWFRPSSGKEWKRAALAADEFAKGGNAGKIDQLFTMLKSPLVGWDNLTDLEGNPIPFDREQLDAVLDMEEAAELLGRLSLSAADKKK